MNRIVDTKDENKKSINFKEDFYTGNNVEHFHGASGGVGGDTGMGGPFPRPDKSSQNQQFKS